MSETISKALRDAKCTSQDGTFVHASMDEVLRAVGSAQCSGAQPAAWRWRTLPRFSEDAEDTEWTVTTTAPDFINPHHHEVEPLYPPGTRTPAASEDVKDLAIDVARHRIAELIDERDEARALVESMRECLQSIADMKEDEPREPDDADWRWRALECKRCATVTLTSTNRHPDCQGADAVCHHPACACAFPPHVRQPE